jgi:hypothetical protein
MAKSTKMSEEAWKSLQKSTLLYHVEEAVDKIMQRPDWEERISSPIKLALGGRLSELLFPDGEDASSEEVEATITTCLAAIHQVREQMAKQMKEIEEDKNETRLILSILNVD